MTDPLEIKLRLVENLTHAKELINDPEIRVRMKIAMFHYELAKELITDPESDVKIELTKYPDLAEKLITDRNWEVRYHVVKYPELARKLLGDKDIQVRGEARRTLGMTCDQEIEDE